MVSLVSAVLVFVFLVVIGFVIVGLLRPFMRAFMSGCPITFLQIVAMRIRETHVNHVIDLGIKASQAGHPIDCVELERAYLSGVDIEQVVLAYITAKKRELGLSFEEIVDAARESRLDELLKR